MNKSYFIKIKNVKDFLVVIIFFGNKQNLQFKIPLKYFRYLVCDIMHLINIEYIKSFKC